MTALPPERIHISKLFTNVRVDIAGPKGCACVFVCFGTKAIHLEPTSDLSIQAFMEAFARIFREGDALSLFTRITNGTNFIGASKLLKKELQEFIKQLTGSAISATSF